MQVEVQVIDEVHIHLLPPDKENQACLEIGDKNHCGRGGDVRAAEQPGLTSLHTLFVREHNRIAGLLYSDHSDWDDDRLYQEARQILVAVMQKITYDEFLPLVLGKEIMDKYKLGSWNGYDGYNKTVFILYLQYIFELGYSNSITTPNIVSRWRHKDVKTAYL